MAMPVWSRFARESRSARHNTWFGIMREFMKGDVVKVIRAFECLERWH
jgi:hypothetical protein